MLPFSLILNKKEKSFPSIMRNASHSINFFLILSYSIDENKEFMLREMFFQGKWTSLLLLNEPDREMNVRTPVEGRNFMTQLELTGCYLFSIPSVPEDLTTLALPFPLPADCHSCYVQIENDKTKLLYIDEHNEVDFLSITVVEDRENYINNLNMCMLIHLREKPKKFLYLIC